MTIDGPAASTFDEFYRREWRPLTALGWTLTGSWSTAEELAQEALLDAHRRWEVVGRMDKPGAWVRRAVVNRSASHRRRLGAESRAMQRFGTMSATAPSTSGDAAAGLDAADAAFWAAVRSLPDRQLHCLSLHYLEDRPVAEIASILGCATATVKVHLYRGRQALASRLQEATGDIVPLERTDGRDDVNDEQDDSEEHRP